MKESQAIEALGALGHEVRLRIIKHLIKQGDEGAAAGAIGKVVKAAPSKVTFHISALERAGLVVSTRVSRSIVYRVQFDQMGKLIGYLLDDCCQSNPEVLSKCSVGKSLQRCR